MRSLPASPAAFTLPGLTAQSQQTLQLASFVWEPVRFASGRRRNRLEILWLYPLPQQLNRFIILSVDLILIILFRPLDDDTIVRAYWQKRGEEGRDTVITTFFSHPSDAACPIVKGYKVIVLPPDEEGLPDLEAYKAALDEHTAAIFMTNPEDTGIFNRRIREFTRLAHEVGALCCYDQANANGLLGITRTVEADFDMSFFNLHKTFSSPYDRAFLRF